MGEIYNILGTVLPVKKGPKPEFGFSYGINGKTIVTSEDLGSTFQYNFIDGFPNVQYPRIDLDNPIFGVKVLDVFKKGTDKHGLTDWFERANFRGKALFGYPVSYVSYIADSIELPSKEKLDSLVLRLTDDFKEKLGIEINKDHIGLHLLWEF